MFLKSVASNLIFTVFGVVLGIALTGPLQRYLDEFSDQWQGCDTAYMEAAQLAKTERFAEAARYYRKAMTCSTPTGVRAAAQLAEYYCRNILPATDPIREADALLRQASEMSGAAMFDIQLSVAQCYLAGWGIASNP